MLLFAFLTSPDSRPMALWAATGAVLGIGLHLILQIVPTPVSPLLSPETAIVVAIVGGLAGGSLWWRRHPETVAASVHLARVTSRAMDGDTGASAELEHLTAERRARLFTLAATDRAAKRQLLRELTSDHAALGALLQEPEVRADPALAQRITEDRARLTDQIGVMRAGRQVITPARDD